MCYSDSVPVTRQRRMLMPTEAQAIADPQERLLETDNDYRKLHETHRAYDSRLVELSEKRLLTQEEELEEMELKKKKLFLKDQMAARVRSLQDA